ncbi:hypothetical protein QR680_008909 [Steinernema hermaphroditum]|uniref:Uncharacterized protein n=1 Tax=Steinernema hermaphroditum TaxID=289476 RepID=A0AA39M7X1_9BILA|nr:hypothetical protein QR680_008909 [Steinernema hermaphroditum]
MTKKSQELKRWSDLDDTDPYEPLDGTVRQLTAEDFRSPPVIIPRTYVVDWYGNTVSDESMPQDGPPIAIHPGCAIRGGRGVGANARGAHSFQGEPTVSRYRRRRDRDTHQEPSSQALLSVPLSPSLPQTHVSQPSSLKVQLVSTISREEDTHRAVGEENKGSDKKAEPEPFCLAASISAKMESYGEIPVRFYEQGYTTVETMRRRCLDVYDFAAAAGKKSKLYVEKFREWAEPTALDCKDYVTAALTEKSNLQAESKDTRNDLVELYLGIGVITLAMASGFIAGSFYFGVLLDFVFDRSFMLLLLILIPVYTYLYMTKGAILYDVETRFILYGMVLVESFFAGHIVGYRMAALIPAASFALPVVTGLLIDREIAPEAVFSARDKFMLYCSLGGAAISLGLALPFGVATLGALVCLLLQVALLGVHFQITMAEKKAKTFSSGHSQFVYVLALISIHVFCALLFGSSSAQ